MLFLFLTVARGADAMPILNQQCTTNQIFNATQYQCLACPATFVVLNGTCRPSAQNYLWTEGADPTLAASYTAQCSTGYTELNMTCYNTSVQTIDQLDDIVCQVGIILTVFHHPCFKLDEGVNLIDKGCLTVDFL